MCSPHVTHRRWLGSRIKMMVKPHGNGNPGFPPPLPRLFAPIPESASVKPVPAEPSPLLVPLSTATTGHRTGLPHPPILYGTQVLTSCPRGVPGTAATHGGMQPVFPADTHSETASLSSHPVWEETWASRPEPTRGQWAERHPGTRGPQGSLGPPWLCFHRVLVTPAPGPLLTCPPPPPFHLLSVHPASAPFPGDPAPSPPTWYQE